MRIQTTGLVRPSDELTANAVSLLRLIHCKVREIRAVAEITDGTRYADQLVAHAGGTGPAFGGGPARRQPVPPQGAEALKTMSA